MFALCLAPTKSAVLLFIRSVYDVILRECGLEKLLLLVLLMSCFTTINRWNLAEYQPGRPTRILANVGRAFYISPLGHLRNSTEQKSYLVGGKLSEDCKISAGVRSNSPLQITCILLNSLCITYHVTSHRPQLL